MQPLLYQETKFHNMLANIEKSCENAVNGMSILKFYLQLTSTSQIPSANPHIKAILKYAVKSFATAVHSCIQINRTPCSINVHTNIDVRPTTLDIAVASAAATAFATPNPIIT